MAAGGSPVFEIGRLVVLIALVVAAAALATPKGRLPLALRGVLKIVRRDAGIVRPAEAERVAPTWKRLLSLGLVLLALLLAVI